jgi:hypothetical protein
MVDTNGGDFVSPGLRYFASIENGAPAQVGAYLPDYDGDLTVYWRGHVGRDDIRSLVAEAEAALAKSGQPVSGTFDAYGIEAPNPDDTERHIGPLPFALANSLAPKSGLPDFDACRAELTVGLGKVIIWANVTGEQTAALEYGGENIGVSVPQSLFGREGIRPVIEHAISTTMQLKPKFVAKLLNDISNAIQTRALSAG